MSAGFVLLDVLDSMRNGLPWTARDLLDELGIDVADKLEQMHRSGLVECQDVLTEAGARRWWRITAEGRRFYKEQVKAQGLGGHFRRYRRKWGER